MWNRLLGQIKSRLPQRITWGTFYPMIRVHWRRHRIQGRLIPLATHPTTQGFAISLAFHLLLFGTIEAGHRMGWWKHRLLPANFLTRKAKPDSRLAQQNETKRSEVVREIPIIFVEVDPTQAVEQPPEETKYYSSRSSRAANRETPVDSNIPKITGTQDVVPKTLEHSQPQPQPEPQPLQPAPLVENKPEPPRVEPKPEPKSGPKPGDLAMEKPSEETKIHQDANKTEMVEPAPPPRRRPPRKLSEVKVAQAGSLGEKVKQDGGVRRFATVEGLDVRATPFGLYDAAIIEAIRQRWYVLLDERDFAPNFSGKVVLTFRLNSDGRITQMGVAENEVGEILALICQRAVLDPAPYASWPNDMRRLVGGDYREVRFTFHYH